MGRRGMTVGLQYVHRFTDRHKHVRYYFRKNGRRTRLPGLPGSPEFMGAYSKALEAAAPDAPPQARRVIVAGSFADLATRYYASPRFLKLAASSRTNYRRIIDGFLQRHGHRLVAQTRRSKIETLLAEYVDRPGAGIVFLKRLRGLLAYAVAQKWIETNPAAGVETFDSEEIHTWTEAEIAAFEKRWPLGTTQRLGFDLHLYTGQRGSDVCRMARPDSSGKIRIVQQKTKNRVVASVHPALQASLDACRLEHSVILATAYGKPFSVKGFQQFMSAAIRKAGLPEECVPHGLRKAAGRRLAEAGCTAHEIMSVLGLKTLAEAGRYTRAAEQERLNSAAMKKVANA
jgi:integrase